jgi:hypothetical protein
MKKILIITLGLILILAVLTGATSCGKYIPEESTPSGGDLNPPTLAQSDFNFIFKYGVTGRTTLDTYQGTYTKDMVMDPDITIELKLSQEEMDSIYQKMVEIDFFKYPDEFSVSVPVSERKAEVTPYSTYFFQVTYGDKTKELLWHDKIMNPDEKADKLKGLINFIINIIESKEEYKALPKANGGYI